MYLYTLSLQVLIGNREWMSLNSVERKEATEKKMKEFEGQGKTVVMVAVDGKYESTLPPLPGLQATDKASPPQKKKKNMCKKKIISSLSFFLTHTCTCTQEF